ncbi:hypothetical protein EBQ26_06425 [Allofranklinella schreckenbergeri]|uniref:Uncharacterized protein n=1 Tax=Allofranklinella schreckenbergeri TaxID=1076744 RepID=A0A3M6Q8F1_9BURK|nr:hypothetical protein EBQ26_06425 [Allofranklinella schreckenbergeri]
MAATTAMGNLQAHLLARMACIQRGEVNVAITLIGGDAKACCYEFGGAAYFSGRGLVDDLLDRVGLACR